MTKTTNYRKAWLDYRKTNAYKELSSVLKNQGIKQPYRNNIIESSFAAGWRASGVKIEWIK